MKNKKYYALGLAGALSASMLTATPVFAAHTSGGSTEFTYTAGQSTGTDPDDGSLADWTVDYPVKVVLDDATINAASGRTMNFKLYNTNESGAATNAYTGSSAVTVTLKSHAQTDNSDGIKMMNGGAAKDNVVMSITGDDGTTAIATNADTDVMTLDSTDNALTSKAYLKKNSGAEKGKTYTQTLTWIFEDSDI